MARSARATPPGRARVVQVVTRMNVGGPARHVIDVARALQQHYDVRVLAGTPPAEEGLLEDAEVAVRSVPLVRPVRPTEDLLAFASVRRELARTSPQVVHTHMAKAGAIGRLATLSLRERPRTIHTFHGHVLAGYFSSRTQQAFLRIERSLAGRTDRLVAVSQEIRDELLDLGIGRPDQYDVIPVGLDLRPFLHAPRTCQLRGALGLDPDTPLAGILARLVPIKDHRTLFDALRRRPGLHLAVLGDGEMRTSLEALARDLGIAERVHFTGWWQDVPAALADLDVAVLSSRNEGTPVALMEAAACGRPIVATGVGGVPSVVQDQRTGLLVPPGDPEALAVALGQVIEDPALAARLGRAAQEAATRFSITATIDALRALYDDLSR